MNKNVQNINKAYWNEALNDFLGAVTLPKYGAFTATEDSLQLFGDVAGKTLLDIGCGNGQSLVYHGERGAGELWGLDISEKQLQVAAQNLSNAGLEAKLLCAPMEADCGLPIGHFDFVYAIYAIGWTTDLPGTFARIAAYLKPGGSFIFSWTHPLHYCTALSDGAVTFARDYFGEDWEPKRLDGKEVSLCNRQISTYVNALAGAGLVIDRMSEATDSAYLTADHSGNPFLEKAKTVPATLIVKAHKPG